MRRVTVIVDSMASKMFINLPVRDLKKSIGFLTRLGFSFSPKYTKGGNTHMVRGGDIFASLLTEDRFREFARKSIAEAKKHTEGLMSIDAGYRDKVGDVIQKFAKNGGALYRDSQDQSLTDGQGFANVDKHQWEILFMEGGWLQHQ